MNITIICDVLGKENNGTTIATMNLIRSLKSKNHNVKVVCPDPDKKNLEGFYTVKPFNFGPLNGYVQKNGVSIAKSDKKVLTEAIKGSDIIHLSTPFGLSMKSISIANEMNIPITASFHCQAENITNHIFMMNFSFANKFTYKYIYKHVFSKCDAIHYPTQFIRDVFEEACNHKTNGYVISNGVNKNFTVKSISKPKELENKFVIVSTGRYSKEKSHKILIEAAALSKYSEKIQLVLAGTGPLKNKLTKFSEKKLVNLPIFKFFGRNELVDMLNCADLYVHPAEIEIEAISCIEAICCGLVPVISDSNRSATNKFALDDRSLFKCNDPKSLADKIDYWIEHSEEKKILRQQYLDNIKKFDVDECMNRMEQMLADIVRSHNEKK